MKTVNVVGLDTIRIISGGMVYIKAIELMFSLDRVIAAEFREGFLYLWLLGAGTNPTIITEEAIALGLWKLIKCKLLDDCIQLRYNPDTSEYEPYTGA